MKIKLASILALSLLVLICAPGARGEINPFFKPQLDLPSLNLQQAPVVYTAGYGYTSFGIKLFGGLTFGSVRHSDEEGAAEYDQYLKSLMGFAGGVGFETGGQVGVEVDLMYVQKGFKLDTGQLDAGGGEWISYAVDMIINELAVPVLLRFKFMPGTSPYILLGGSVAYVMSATAKWKYSDSQGQSDQSDEDLFKQDTNILNRLDYGIVGGAGLELAMETLRLYFEGRYSLGLANLLHKDQTEGTDSWIKLSTFLLLFGIGF